MSTIDLSVVLVHYRTPDLLLRAIGALELDLRSSDLDAEIIVVDNSGELLEHDLESARSVRLLSPGRNLGYAGAARLAVESRPAEMVLLMNCDVLVQPGCIDRLVEQLRGGASIAGPSLYWDEALEIRLPPAEPRSRKAELALAWTHRFPSSAKRLRRARRRHSHRHWQAQSSLESVSLSGCLLAFERQAWLDTDGMDELFQLYFEETDWLLRAQAAGHSIRYVPEASAVHLYDRSASGEPEASIWYQESARKFRDRHYGTGFSMLLEVIAGGGGESAPASAASPDAPKLRIPEEVRGGWLEIGAAPFGYPAAATRLSKDQESWQMPPEIWNPLRPGHYTLIIVDRNGREHGLYTIRKG